MNFSSLLIVLVFLLYTCQSQTNKKINGISFVASSKKIDSTHTSPVKKVSANFVALIPFSFIRHLTSPKVVYNFKRQWFGETEAGIIQYAKEFKKQGIQIMIKPQIWVFNGIYTGEIKMTSEEDWRQLENTYENFIIHYAETAETLKAPIFCLGTELREFIKHRPIFWQNLIKKIRKIYYGKITYAANWDDYKDIPFWNELDYIGIDAYFPLTNKKNPTITDFEKGWRPYKKELEQIQKKIQKPVLFTEFGYRSINFTGKQPWQSNTVSGQVNLNAQQNGLQAIYNQFWNEEWFAGGFLWKWFIDYKKAGGVENNRFTPQNKPAEKLIKELYAK